MLILQQNKELHRGLLRNRIRDRLKNASARIGRVEGRSFTHISINERTGNGDDERDADVPHREATVTATLNSVELNNLSREELMLVQILSEQELTERELSAKTGIPKSTIHKRLTRIAEKQKTAA